MSEILVVDDEPGIRTLVQEILEEEGYEVRLAENGETARQAMLERQPDLVLLDIWMPDLDGISLLKEWVSTGQAGMPVVMMSGHGTVHTAVEATRLGAFDFLEKPVPYKRLLETVERALRQAPKPAELPANLAALGEGEAVQLMLNKLRHAAASEGPILLSAEPGAGAEECAQFLRQPKTPWVVAADLNRLADRPLELLAEAKGGLLFIPEVGNLTPFQQRGLQMILARRSEYAARVVCASSVNLAEKAAQGGYSRDLYNALARVAVRVPPLREHAEDIPILANRVLAQVAEQHGGTPRRFSAEALRVLGAHAWPGNLDELRNVVSSLAVAADGEVIEAADVNAMLGVSEHDTPVAMGLRIDMPLKDARDEFERTYLVALLEACGWAVSKAATRAGMERTAFYRKLKSLGIELPHRTND
ncbi:MAG: sigma-54 dependent transcriptional regulator [Thiobacillaceae bacterium]|jgi:DNA-binding NtrC family response regulator|nr:sigma-54 dependent transcriptional regulator [Thiobacillaceae bacterium]